MFTFEKLFGNEIPYDTWKKLTDTEEKKIEVKNYLLDTFSKMIKDKNYPENYIYFFLKEIELNKSISSNDREKGILFFKAFTTFIKRVEKKSISKIYIIMNDLIKSYNYRLNNNTNSSKINNMSSSDIKHLAKVNSPEILLNLAAFSNGTSEKELTKKAIKQAIESEINTDIENSFNSIINFDYYTYGKDKSIEKGSKIKDKTIEELENFIKSQDTKEESYLKFQAINEKKSNLMINFQSDENNIFDKYKILNTDIYVKLLTILSNPSLFCDIWDDTPVEDNDNIEKSGTGDHMSIVLDTEDSTESLIKTLLSSLFIKINSNDISIINFLDRDIKEIIDRDTTIFKAIVIKLLRIVLKKKIKSKISYYSSQKTGKAENISNFINIESFIPYIVNFTVEKFIIEKIYNNPTYYIFSYKLLNLLYEYDTKDRSTKVSNLNTFIDNKSRSGNNNEVILILYYCSVLKNIGDNLSTLNIITKPNYIHQITLIYNKLFVNNSSILTFVKERNDAERLLYEVNDTNPRYHIIEPYDSKNSANTDHTHINSKDDIKLKYMNLKLEYFNYPHRIGFSDDTLDASGNMNQPTIYFSKTKYDAGMRTQTTKTAAEMAKTDIIYNFNINYANKFVDDNKSTYSETYMLGVINGYFKSNITSAEMASAPHCGKLLLNKLQNGENIILIGNGQSGSGKTSTLINFKDPATNNETPGILPAIVSQLINPNDNPNDTPTSTDKYNTLDNCLSDNNDNNIYFNYAELSMFNLYSHIDDKMYDMNSINKFTYKHYHPYKINLPSKNGGKISKILKFIPKLNSKGQLDWLCFDEEKKDDTLGSIIAEAFEIREVYPTKNNPNSSRSHIIVCITFKSLVKNNKTFEDCIKTASIVVCDLAGVEDEFTCSFQELKILDNNYAFGSEKYKCLLNEASVNNSSNINECDKNNALNSILDSNDPELVGISENDKKKQMRNDMEFDNFLCENDVYRLTNETNVDTFIPKIIILDRAVQIKLMQNIIKTYNDIKDNDTFKYQIIQDSINEFKNYNITNNTIFNFKDKFISFINNNYGVTIINNTNTPIKLDYIYNDINSFINNYNSKKFEDYYDVSIFGYNLSTTSTPDVSSLLNNGLIKELLKYKIYDPTATAPDPNKKNEVETKFNELDFASTCNSVSALITSELLEVNNFMKQYFQLSTTLKDRVSFDLMNMTDVKTTLLNELKVALTGTIIKLDDNGDINNKTDLLNFEDTTLTTDKLKDLCININGIYSESDHNRISNLEGIVNSLQNEINNLNSKKVILDALYIAINNKEIILRVADSINLSPSITCNGVTISGDLNIISNLTYPMDLNNTYMNYHGNMTTAPSPIPSGPSLVNRFIQPFIISYIAKVSNHPAMVTKFTDLLTRSSSPINEIIGKSLKLADIIHYNYNIVIKELTITLAPLSMALNKINKEESRRIATTTIFYPLKDLLEEDNTSSTTTLKLANANKISEFIKDLYTNIQKLFFDTEAMTPNIYAFKFKILSGKVGFGRNLITNGPGPDQSLYPDFWPLYPIARDLPPDGYYHIRDFLEPYTPDVEIQTKTTNLNIHKIDLNQFKQILTDPDYMTKKTQIFELFVKYIIKEKAQELASKFTIFSTTRTNLINNDIKRMIKDFVRIHQLEFNCRLRRQEGYMINTSLKEMQKVISSTILDNSKIEFKNNLIQNNLIKLHTNSDNSKYIYKLNELYYYQQEKIKYFNILFDSIKKLISSIPSDIGIISKLSIPIFNACKILKKNIVNEFKYVIQLLISDISIGTKKFLDLPSIIIQICLIDTLNRIFNNDNINLNYIQEILLNADYNFIITLYNYIEKKTNIDNTESFKDIYDSYFTNKTSLEDNFIKNLFIVIFDSNIHDIDNNNDKEGSFIGYSLNILIKYKKISEETDASNFKIYNLIYTICKDIYTPKQSDKASIFFSSDTLAPYDNQDFINNLHKKRHAANEANEAYINAGNTKDELSNLYTHMQSIMDKLVMQITNKLIKFNDYLNIFKNSITDIYPLIYSPPKYVSVDQNNTVSSCIMNNNLYDFDYDNFYIKSNTTNLVESKLEIIFNIMKNEFKINLSKSNMVIFTVINITPHPKEPVNNPPKPPFINTNKLKLIYKILLNNTIKTNLDTTHFISLKEKIILYINFFYDYIITYPFYKPFFAIKSNYYNILKTESKFTNPNDLYTIIEFLDNNNSGTLIGTIDFEKFTQIRQVKPDNEPKDVYFICDDKINNILKQTGKLEAIKNLLPLSTLNPPSDLQVVVNPAMISHSTSHSTP